MTGSKRYSYFFLCRGMTIARAVRYGPCGAQVIDCWPCAGSARSKFAKSALAAANVPAGRAREASVSDPDPTRIRIRKTILHEDTSFERTRSPLSSLTWASRPPSVLVPTSLQGVHQFVYNTVSSHILLLIFLSIF